MCILQTGHQPGVYVPLRALFLVVIRLSLSRKSVVRVTDLSCFTVDVKQENKQTTVQDMKQWARIVMIRTKNGKQQFKLKLQNRYILLSQKVVTYLPRCSLIYPN